MTLPALLLLSIAPAMAAPGEQRAAASAEEPAVVMNRFAECVATRWRRSMHRVLQETPGSSDERARLSGAIAEWGLCMDDMPSELRRRVWEADYVRGPFAEILFEQDFADGVTPRRREFARLPDPVVTVRRRNLPEPVLRAAIVGVFAACMVERRPAEAAALLRTPPASAAERTAVAALSPEFGHCFPAGSSFDITIPLLRGYLATALYRRGVALASAEPAREAAE